MINTAELRIGNLCQDREGRLCEVEQLSKDPEDCKIRARDYAITSLPVKPIEITSAWLTRLGFKINENEYRYQIDDDFYYKDGYCWFGLPDGQFWRYVKKGVNYIHEVQNLYFVITGKELKL